MMWILKMCLWEPQASQSAAVFQKQLVFELHCSHICFIVLYYCHTFCIKSEILRSVNINFLMCNNDGHWTGLLICYILVVSCVKQGNIYPVVQHNIPEDHSRTSSLTMIVNICMCISCLLTVREEFMVGFIVHFTHSEQVLYQLQNITFFSHRLYTFFLKEMRADVSMLYIM
jgi:hypothetical protein